jgi:hypothetical protein
MPPAERTHEPALTRPQKTLDLEGRVNGPSAQHVGSGLVRAFTRSLIRGDARPEGLPLVVAVAEGHGKHPQQLVEA